jgi:hypothetical protein
MQIPHEILTPRFVPKLDLVKSAVNITPIVAVFGAWGVGVECVPMHIDRKPGDRLIPQHLHVEIVELGIQRFSRGGRTGILQCGDVARDADLGVDAKRPAHEWLARPLIVLAVASLPGESHRQN